jgi:molybdenum cofactor synthesis domain-containing protein
MLNSESKSNEEFSTATPVREMISISKAISIIARETGRLGSEIVSINAAVGRVLAEDIVADADLPPFDRSQMDGFAVFAADTEKAPVELKIVGESAAGRGWHKRMNRGEAVRIMTGAPVPAGPDSVQRVELTRETGNSVNILAPATKGGSVVKKGAEVKKGKIIFRPGEMITENMIAVLASFGYAKLKVFRKPRIGILATGSEVVDITRKPGRDQIRNSNSAMLRAFVEKCASIASVFPVSGDDLSNLKFQIRKAAKANDVLIVTGGVSVGKYDLTKAALSDLGAEIYFEKVKLKPGKPTVFARLGKTLVFGLPGNPVSAAVTFQLFVRMAILQMQSATNTQPGRAFAVLGKDAKAARDRDTFLPATLSTDKSGRLVAMPLRSQGSSDFVGFARAEALIFIKAGDRYKIGDVVQIRYL